MSQEATSHHYPYKVQPPIGRSGGLSTETFIAHPDAVPRTTVQSPLAQMTEGFGNLKSRVRPTKISHPYFGKHNVASDIEGDVASDMGSNPIEKFVGAVAGDIEDYDNEMVSGLIADMNNYDSGWQSLDVWEEN